MTAKLLGIILCHHADKQFLSLQLSPVPHRNARGVEGADPSRWVRTSQFSILTCHLLCPFLEGHLFQHHPAEEGKQAGFSPVAQQR